MSVIRRFAGAVVMLGIYPVALSACPVCFQVEPDATTAGVRAAVITLIVVTCGVLTAFGVFIARFVARTRGLDN